jgi:His Kinase A (phospho-acceptor) domain
MIATILALPLGGESARTIMWRQLVDIVAQAGDRLDPETRAAAHARIAALGPGVSPPERRSAAASLAGRAGAQTVAIFAADAPAVAAPVLARAQLSDEAWLALIPTLPPPSRSILRNRRDLSPAVERALASYGVSDFALPSAEGDADSSSQIRNLVERIESFRRQQPLGAPVPPRTVDPDVIAAPQAAADLFSFETGDHGMIDWVDGVPRTALIGMSIGEGAPPREAGVDGQAAGAFRRRAPFRNARLVVAGQSEVGGEWLITAQPIFDPRNGRFAGYRGEARRPRPEDHARHFGGERIVPLAPDSLRQLVHELRTPLNAIQGFADMIDQQMLGPAAAAYRDHARSIAGESRRLLEVVEDIDVAARLQSQPGPLAQGESDATAIVAETVAGFERSLAARGVAIDARLERDLTILASEAQFARLAQRLLTMVTGLAVPGETIGVRLSSAGATATLSIKRARVLAGVSEQELLEPGFGPEGEWPSAPLLGLGFSMRLLANLARSVHGSFVVEPDAFTLGVPRQLRQGDVAGEQG